MLCKLLDYIEGPNFCYITYRLLVLFYLVVQILHELLRWNPFAFFAFFFLLHFLVQVPNLMTQLGLSLDNYHLWLSWGLRQESCGVRTGSLGHLENSWHFIVQVGYGFYLLVSYELFVVLLDVSVSWETLAEVNHFFVSYTIHIWAAANWLKRDFFFFEHLHRLHRVYCFIMDFLKILHLWERFTNRTQVNFLTSRIDAINRWLHLSF